MNFNDSNVQAAAGFLQANMATIETEVYRIEYPEYKYSSFVPLDTSAPNYAPQVGFRVLDYRGALKPYSAQSTDIPTTDVAAQTLWHPIQEFSNGYRYTIMELEQARLGNLQLDIERATAVRATTEKGLNQIFLSGALKDESGTDIAYVGEGLYTGPSVHVSTAGAKLKDIIAKGGDSVAQNVLNVFNDAYNKVYIDQTNTVHKPNTFVLPPSIMRLLGSTLLGPSNASNFTLLQFLKANYPDCTFEDDVLLEKAGVNGSGRLVCYKKDIRVVKGHLPMPLQFMQMEGPQNMAFYVPAICRTGGTEWRIPSAAHYVDGI